MKYRITKHAIPLQSEFTLITRWGSRVLKVSVINERAYLWIVEPQDTARIPVSFIVISDNEEFELPSTYQYVDTFVLCYGEFVRHLWMDTAARVQINGKVME